MEQSLGDVVTRALHRAAKSGRQDRHRAQRISRFPEVRSVYLVSGGHDLRCTVTGHSIRAISDFVSQKLSTIERVQATATHFVLKAYKRDGVVFAEPEPDHRLRVTP